VDIFGLRYGSVVSWGTPPRPTSITELEYRAAEKKTRLIFLLDEDAAWRDEYKDAVTGENDQGKRIAALRTELMQSHLVRFFSTPEALALQVTLSIFGELSLDKPKKFDLPERLTEMQDIQQFGPSLMQNIEEQVKQAAKGIKGTKCVEVNLGIGESWWSARLYLLASLAVDFTGIREIVFVDSEERFIGLSPPLVVKRGLWTADWHLQSLYKENPQGVDPEFGIVNAISSFRLQLLNAGIPEKELKVLVTADRLKYWLRSDLEQRAVSIEAETSQNAFFGAPDHCRTVRLCSRNTE
jgi:hypothetical protein